MTITIKIDNVPKIEQSIKDLSKTRILVGIPEEKGGRKPVINSKGKEVADTMNNATLGYIHEFGSPANNRPPARPFLIPGVAESRPIWEPYMTQAADAAFSGDTSKMLRAFEAAGSKASLAVQKKIKSKIPPPLKPSTVAARKRNKGPKGKARIAAYGKFYEKFQAGQATIGDSTVTPLIDTEQLLGAITYVVKTK